MFILVRHNAWRWHNMPNSFFFNQRRIREEINESIGVITHYEDEPVTIVAQED